MTINSVSTNMTSMYSNYRTTGNYSQTTSDSSTTQSAVEENGRPAGPPPGGKGGPPPGGGKGGPDLDTDSDGSWSASEVEEYASYSSETLGIEVDSESIMSTYDIDEDGSISASERTALASDNALNLPSPQNMSRQMMGTNQLQYQLSTESTSSSSETETSTSQDILNQLLMAYNQENSTAVTDLLSTVEFNV